METDVVVSALDPELLARLDLILGRLESINYFLSVLMVAVLLTLGCAVAVSVVVFLYRAFKQFI